MCYIVAQQSQGRDSCVGRGQAGTGFHLGKIGRIFQIAGDLTEANSAIVTLSGGAQAKNIFWVVGGQATLETSVQFNGIILSQTLVSMNTGAALLGRAFAHTEVTLNQNVVTKPD